MANSKISALTSATTVAGTEVLPIVQSSATVKVSVANLTPGLNTITAAKGGTGQTSYAVGDLLYADTTTTLAKLADVATGSALISGGISTAPSWGKIGLTTHVSGTLPTANGGTNLTSFTANGVVYASSTSALATSSAITFNGTNLVTTGSATFQSNTRISNASNVAVMANMAAVTSGIGGTNAGTTSTYVQFDNAQVYPLLDNTLSLGLASYRWTTVYATTPLINTSDINTKQDISELNDAEKRVATRIKSLIKKYRFKDAVIEKGDAARIHIGIIAQEVQSAFVAESLDATRYGIFCSDTWYEVDGKQSPNASEPYQENTPNSTKVVRLGLRYEELFAFVISAL